jgi:hypothetical protein
MQFYIIYDRIAFVTIRITVAPIVKPAVEVRIWCSPQCYPL